jgi:hypothetical protein
VGRCRETNCARLLTIGDLNFSYIKKAPMKYPRFDHTVCYHNDTFFIVSGSSIDYESGRSVELYDRMKNIWYELPKIAEPRYQHCSTVYK